MKKIVLNIAILLLSAFTANAQQSWSNDPAHSYLGFMVQHLTVTQINGKFDDFKINVVTTKADYSDMKVTLVAKTKSINTGIEMRDNHLRTPDFFDVEKYSEMTFVSTSCKKKSKKSFLLFGNLTILGVTKPVKLLVSYNGNAENPMSHKQAFGFHIAGAIKRSDYGIGAKFPEAIISNDIKIIADAEMYKD